MKSSAVEFSVRHPRTIILSMIVLVVVLGALIPRIAVDTDPENMLPADQPQRVLHDLIKERFSLWDVIVVGMVNERDANGIFNLASLSRLYQLSHAIVDIDGVVGPDLMSLAAVDNISQEGVGAIRFQWMMDAAPESAAQVQEIRQAVERLPLLRSTLVSADGRAAGIYVPIERKSESHRIATEIEALIADLGVGDDEFHITGLPVAEDTFGVEMFRQMAISAPLAGLVIFIMMWFFFRSLSLIAAPMILAMATVVATMGLLIGLGFTVHIMSSMIPIFLMPIAVVDSVHVLSEFSDRYRPGQDVRQAVREVMAHLFVPMLFTSITTVVGFASLALTPIPPVRVFGLFVAAGIALAFVLTITFIPAYIALLSPRRLASLAGSGGRESASSPLARALRWCGPASVRAAKPLLIVFALVFVASVYGITRIEVNDNPVRWFEANHPIRIADRVLNHHFAGTYNAFLVLDKPVAGEASAFDQRVESVIEEAESAGVALRDAWARLRSQAADDSFPTYLQNLELAVGDALFEAETDALPWWEQLQAAVEETASAVKYFQNPEALRYIDELQAALEAGAEVGKVNSLTTLVKTVYRELQGGEDDAYRLPGSAAAVAQTLLSFQSSHRPDDLWHMVTPDYRSSALWLQLASGDNQDMIEVERQVDEFTAAHPLPDGVEIQWGGLTFINSVWQEAMVSGMARSLVGSFVMVLIIMIVLFRSPLFGTLAMVPLSFTIVLIYGVIGFLGRDYDMPIAVLSSLTLGLSVDFAIHFLQRARTLRRRAESWRQTVEQLFEEPARAITRNALVIAVGFTPLLAAPLVPYQTVGLFLATIMAVSALSTLVLLPALMHVLQRRLFKAQGGTS